MIKRIIFLCFVSAGILSAQEVNIDPFLRQIEAGNIFVAKKNLNELKIKYPDNPEVKYLDAVLTEDGSEAVVKFDEFYKAHNGNKFADDALYRIYSYYYSLGVYNKANLYFNILKNSYPSSPYLNEKNVALSGEISGDESQVDLNKQESATKIEREIENAETVSENMIEAAPAQSKYTVQAGAFMNVKNAVSLKDNLTSDGYDSSIQTKEVGGSILNVVTAGKFTDEQSALSLLDHLSKKYKLKGRVVSLK